MADVQARIVHNRKQLSKVVRTLPENEKRIATTVLAVCDEISDDYPEEALGLLASFSYAWKEKKSTKPAKPTITQERGDDDTITSSVLIELPSERMRDLVGAFLSQSRTKRALKSKEVTNVSVEPGDMNITLVLSLTSKGTSMKRATVLAQDAMLKVETMIKKNKKLSALYLEQRGEVIFGD